MATIALDTHAHLVPAIEGGLADFDGVEWDGKALTVDGFRLGMPALFRAQALLDWLDRNGIARAWVSAPPPSYRAQLNEAESSRWCAALNRGLAAICAPHADRLSIMAHLPVEHPALAAEIVAAHEGRRFSMSSGVPERMLSDAAYEPLWHALEAKRAVMLMHPGETPDPRLEPFYLNNLVGNPHETGIAGAHLIVGGVLERHPGLRIILAHAGGSLPMLAGRLERGAVSGRHGLDPALEKPLVAVRRLYADPMAHHPAGLAFAAEIFGAERIVFGSDWPFPMGLPEPAAMLPEGALRDAIFARGDLLDDAP